MRELIEANLKALTIFEANNKCMTVDECAFFLKKHRNTIMKAIHRGDIKASQIGTSYSIPKIQFFKEIIQNES